MNIFVFPTQNCYTSLSTKHAQVGMPEQKDRSVTIHSERNVRERANQQSTSGCLSEKEDYLYECKQLFLLHLKLFLEELSTH